MTTKKHPLDTPDRHPGDLDTITITPLDLAPIDSEADDPPALRSLIGTSVPIRELKAKIRRYASYDYVVLIDGATGTGKSKVAAAIHECSGRAGKPMLHVNSGCFVDSMADSQLFGHERGAFTNAHAQHRGFFEAARGSTLFFDEIGDLPLALQVKLLTAIDNKAYHRVGGTAPVPYDVRLVCATNRDLEKMVGEGTFRADLYRRLKGKRITVPALDERREDVPLLVSNFLDAHRRKYKRTRPYQVQRDVFELLSERTWAGNVGELETFVENLAIEVGERDRITIRDVRAVTQEAAPRAAKLDPTPSRNLARFSDADEARELSTVSVPEYTTGEDVEEYLDRAWLHIYQTVQAQTNSAARTAALMGSDRVLVHRKLKRIERTMVRRTLNSESLGETRVAS